mgnify:CR=1 FL=1
MRGLGKSLWVWFNTRIIMKEEKLGVLWQHSTVESALQNCEIKSTEGGNNVRLCVRNHTTNSVVFCWVDGSSKPHHFRLIEPLRDNNNNKKDAPVTKQDFMERTRTGHAFILATGSNEACQQANRTKSLDELKVIGGYKPESASTEVHLLSVEIPLVDEEDVPPASGFWCCAGHRRRKANNNHDQSKDDVDQIMPILSIRPGVIDSTPIDTTKKEYISAILGGWPVRMEPDWHGGDMELRKMVERDLQHATNCLPPHAYETLKSLTPIWINRSLEYGPEACPIKGIGLCFHPGADWLVENGCHKEKCHAVELYCVQYYKETAGHWGTGGVLLHELSHAYHRLCLPDGYENADIIECYQAAMKDGLYESVQVHGPQGPVAKAYACTDQMEYFAELSAAFLGGKNPDEEYNKWFPFNRSQLKSHDPRAYELLARLWKVNLDNEDQSQT